MNLPTNGQVSAPPTTQKVQVDAGEAHRVSLALIGTLEMNNINMEVGLSALAMSIGRLMSPDIMEPPAEVAYIEWVLEASGAYFAGGVAN